MENKAYYVVRGASMRCTKGTHKRKINLPLGHGAYVNGGPMMNIMDKIAGVNIKYFGICTDGCEDGEDIYLMSEEDEKKQLPPGKKCCVKILDDSIWVNAKENTLVEGQPAITINSFIVCKYGGIIHFVTDGQNDGINRDDKSV